MTPEEQQKFNEVIANLNQLSKKIEDFFNIYYRFHAVDKDVWDKKQYFNDNLFIKDGVKISVGVSTGVTIGLSTEKLGFFGKTPVAKQTVVTTPSGGATIDTQARSSIGEIKTILSNLGITS